MTALAASAQNSASLAGTAVQINLSSLTVNPGDVLQFIVHGNGQLTIADNNGSTPTTKDSITNDDGAGNYKPNPINGQTVSVFRRTFQAGDPTTWFFTLSASGRWGIVAIVYTSSDPVNFYDVVPVGGNNNDTATTTGTVPSITTGSDNSIDCPILLTDGGTILNPHGDPSGYTLQEAVPDNTEPIRFTWKVISPAGATGTRTFTWTGNQAYMGLAFAVKDYTAPPPAVPTKDRLIHMRKRWR